MNYIIYPTVDLFLYDLRDGLGQNSSTIENNQQNFLNKLPKNISADILNRICAHDRQFEPEFIELLGEEPTLTTFEESVDYDGYYYPVRMSDCYGLLIDCSPKDSKQRKLTKEISQLQKLIGDRLKGQPATLGQTWMIYGQVPEGFDSETIAKECYQALFPNTDWEKHLQGKGKLLAGEIFELWQYNLNLAELTASENPNQQIDNLANNHHVIIALYPSYETAEKASELIQDWMHLWCYRSKILWAYRQNRLLKQSLKAKFERIEQYIKKFQTNEYKTLELAQLEANLVEAEDLFAKYAIELNYLDYQTRTVETNWHNYRQRLNAIATKLQLETDPSNLKFLQNFSDFTRNKFLRQAHKDSENLTPGLRMLEVAVSLIRAEVEVIRAQIAEEQNQRDRHFQNMVAIAAAGIGAGSAIASISSQFPTATNVTTAPAHLLANVGVPKDWLAPSISLVYSIGAAIISALLTFGFIRIWLLVKFYPNKSQKQPKQANQAIK